MDTNAVEQRLAAYMRAKYTQIAANRAYGLIFDDRSCLQQLLHISALADI